MQRWFYCCHSRYTVSIAISSIFPTSQPARTHKYAGQLFAYVRMSISIQNHNFNLFPMEFKMANSYVACKLFQLTIIKGVHPIKRNDSMMMDFRSAYIIIMFVCLRDLHRDAQKKSNYFEYSLKDRCLTETKRYSPIKWKFQRDTESTTPYNSSAGTGWIENHSWCVLIQAEIVYDDK